jgi:hypothetical protein
LVCSALLPPLLWLGIGSHLKRRASDPTRTEPPAQRNRIE